MFTLILVFTAAISFNASAFAFGDNLNAKCRYQVDDHTALNFPEMSLTGSSTSVVFSTRDDGDSKGMYILSLSKNNVGEKQMAISLARITRTKGKVKAKGNLSDIFTFNLDDDDVKIMEAKTLELKYRIKRRDIKVTCSLVD